MPGMCGECFLAYMYCLEKPKVLILLAKPDYLVLADKTYDSFSLNCCEPLVMCITYYLFTWTIVAPLGCIDIGVILDFLEKCAKCHL
jgi:hypothetical protein